MGGEEHGPLILKPGFGLVLACLCMIGCQPSGWQRPEREPFRLAFWYWSSPLQFTPDEISQLNRLETDRMLVRAFTVSYDGEKVVPILGQRFVESKGAPPLVLVANLDAGMVRHFREANAEDLQQTVITEFQARQKRAEQAGYRVIGWQLDFDVPTSQLGKYASLLAAVRRKCTGELSISGLQTWMMATSLKAVLEPLDAWYPQFYEGDLPSSPSDQRTLSNLSEKATRIREFGKPFWIGVAAYDSTLAFDPTRKRVGVVRGISLAEAKDRYGEATEWISGTGEAGAYLRVNQGPRAGWYLRYSVPTFDSLKYDLELARSTGARGAALFRYPANGDPTALPLATVAAVWRRESPRIELEVTQATERRPVFDYIERPSGEPGQPKAPTESLTLQVTNEGNVESGPVTITVEGSNFADLVNGGDFPRSDRRNVFKTAGMAPGKTSHFGPIVTDRGRRLKITVSYEDAAGKPEKVELK